MIPLALHALKPMLASTPSGRERPAETIARLDRTGNWLWELKLDGHRCLAYYDAGIVTLKTRKGTVITQRFPEVVNAFAEFSPLATMVFDGELICLVDDRPSLTRIQQRASRTTNLAEAERTSPATFVAFDLLYRNTTDLRNEPYANRIRFLRQAIKFTSPNLRRIFVSSEGIDLWTIVKERHLEGLVAKRAASLYNSGTRSPDWVKVKE